MIRPIKKYEDFLLKQKVTRYYPQTAENGFHLFQQMLLAIASFSKHEIIHPKPLHATVQHTFKRKLIQEYKRHFSNVKYKSSLFSLLEKMQKKGETETEVFDRILSNDYIMNKLDFFFFGGILQTSFNCERISNMSVSVDKGRRKRRRRRTKRRRRRRTFPFFLFCIGCGRNKGKKQTIRFFYY